MELAEAGIATAMIDVSDGLLADLGHILDLSGAGARVDLAKVPLSETFLEQRSDRAEDPFLLPLSGGEDYELLFTAPPAQQEAVGTLLDRLGTRVSVIGEVTAVCGLQVVAADGSDYRVAATGYNHFL